MGEASMNSMPDPEVGARREWIRPEVRRIAAGEAENTGFTGDDGVIGTS